MSKEEKWNFEEMTLIELQGEYHKAVKENNYSRSASIFQFVKENYQNDNY